MPDVPADPVGAVVAILLADADVAARVGTRGFGGELPAAETDEMPRDAFVVKASGGVAANGRGFAEFDTQRVDLYAFGQTPAQAASLADLCALKLRRARAQVADGTFVHWVQSAGGFSSGREPVTDWPRAWRSFQIQYALVKVS